MHVAVSRQAEMMSSGPLSQLLIIGGTGDLSRRHLLPALTRLLANDELPPEFSLIITGVEPMPVEACRALIARELAIHAADLPADAQSSLVARISYLSSDVRNADALQGAMVAEPMLVYFATPPEVVPAAVRAVFHAGIDRAPARLVFDKPFGLSHASAKTLNQQLSELVDERNVYRIDHFLYHRTVQELIRWRVQPDALSLFDSVPANDVEIIWDETRAVQTSAIPYCGVVRDMIQSHLLQLAAIITMESPESITQTDLARHRLAALQQISIASDSGHRSVRRRLAGDGQIRATSKAGSDAETFATVALRSRMPRWQNVNFVLRAAKGVAESRRQIEFRFPQPSARSSHGFVRLEVLAGNLVVGNAEGQTSSFSFNGSGERDTASTRLLRAAISGDDTFTLHPEEPQEAWRIVEPLLGAWETSDTPMQTYRFGASAEDVAVDGEPSDA